MSLKADFTFASSLASKPVLASSISPLIPLKAVAISMSAPFVGSDVVENKLSND